MSNPTTALGQAPAKPSKINPKKIEAVEADLALARWCGASEELPEEYRRKIIRLKAARAAAE
jgi:hypothetical protein